jgi:serine/threonine protein kinase
MNPVIIVYCVVVVYCVALGSVKLTYFGKWDYIQSPIDDEAKSMLYVAPGECWVQSIIIIIVMVELCGLGEASPGADWWSLGAILFELLTGKVRDAAINVIMGYDKH